MTVCWLKKLKHFLLYYFLAELLASLLANCKFRCDKLILYFVCSKFMYTQCRF